MQELSAELYADLAPHAGRPYTYVVLLRHTG